VCSGAVHRPSSRKAERCDTATSGCEPDGRLALRPPRK
jgi:hypothetical protein